MSSPNNTVNATPDNVIVVKPRRRFLWFLGAVLILTPLMIFASRSDLVRTVLSQNKESLAFFAAVVVIAPILWILRSIVESQPDPFFLNMAFYAVAGQCIRTGEAFATHNSSGILSLLLVPAAFLLIMEVLVTRTHEKITMRHYRKRLEESQKEGCPPGEIARWAKLLVKISGTDLSPGSYSWLAIIFEGEPKEESKKQALEILDGNLFNKESKSLTLEKLTIDKDERQRYWLPYVVIPAGSWIVFGCSLFVAR